MTTQEIKDLIASKIAGQGSMVDIGGALPTILNEIVDAIGKPSAPEMLVITTVGGEVSPTQEEINRFIPMVKDNTIYNYVFQMSDSKEFRGRVISTTYLENAQGQPGTVIMTINFTRGPVSTNIVITLLD